MRILTVVGTRPQIVKAAPVSRALREAGHEEVLLFTGQHYDRGLAAAVAEDAGLPVPARSLGVGSGSHAFQAGGIARGVAALAAECRPAAVLAAGDTNSALGAALGARAAGVPLVHGEAGVRLGAFDLPEEANRVAADHLADLLLCPTERAAAAARAEHPRGAIVAAGDPLLDGLPVVIAQGLVPNGRFLCTLHRAENTDDPARLRRILEALATLPHPAFLSIHPRTRDAMARGGMGALPPAILAEGPVSRPTLLAALRSCRAVLTDSGGLQREAYWFGVPCIVLRESCEWRETVEEGWAVCVGADPARIREAAAAPPRGPRPPDLEAFGGGRAAARWVQAIAERFG